MAVSTKVAGRKMVESISMPGRPGRISSRAASTPRVTSRVLPQGSFSTISMSPGPSLMTASPISGWWSTFRSATSPRRSGLPPRCSTGTWARSSGVTMGSLCWISRRWLGVSTNPPVPMMAPLENRRMPASRASAVTSMTWFSDTSLRLSRSGSTWTWYMCSRSPQMVTFATPGTHSSRARIFQRRSSTCRSSTGSWTTARSS